MPFAPSTSIRARPRAAARAELTGVLALASELAADGHPAPRDAALGALAAAIAAAHSVEPSESSEPGDLTALGLPLAAWHDPRDRALRLPPLTRGVAQPELLGDALAALTPAAHRRRTGSVFTPAPVATAVCAAALDGFRAGGAICDPAAGGGAFLLAAARLLVRQGAPLADVLPRLVAVDVDPLAAAVCETALRLLPITSGERADPRARRGPTVLVADPLLEPDVLPPDVALIVGNPPFLGQLSRATARDRRTAAAASAIFGEPAAGYADTALLFLLLAIARLPAGGRVGFVLPESLLATRDAGPVRAAVARNTQLRWLWRAENEVFPAAVRVVGLVAEKAAVPRPPAAVHRIRRSHGAAFAERSAVPVSTAELTERSWSWLVAPRLPAVRLRRDPVPLAVHARATADFRDEYYALVGRVREAADETTPPLGATVGRLVTTGLVDPGRIAWGERGARFARARYAAPVVDLSAPPAALAAWAARRGVPKVLLATQTRVLEPAVDDDGRYLPVPPLIVLEPLAAERLWHVAAALAAPPLSVLALREHAGGALSADAIKLAAREALQLPAPTDPAAWDDAAGAFRLVTQAADVGEWRAALDRFAPIACAAYEITGAEQADVLDWWRARRPDRDGCTGARNDRQFARHRSQQ